MKKLIAFAVALLFLSVTGIAVAADITMSGDYSVQGTYQKNAEDNDAMTAGTTDANEESGTMYYDHEFNLNANWNIDDNTIIYTQFEMRDDIWGSSDPGEGTQLNAAEEADDSNAELDDNIVVEKVYVWHKFANGHQLRVGLMPSGTWGTAFNDDGSEAYRIRYDIPTSAGTILGLIQKVSESSQYSGVRTNTAAESNDRDVYVVGAILKAGDNINVSPLLSYDKDGNTYDAFDVKLAVDGAFGNIGFESEFVITDTDYDTDRPDSRTYGAYAKAWNTSGPVTIGVVGAYGSQDDDASYEDEDGEMQYVARNFGPDFDAGGAKILGYDVTLEGAWLAALYADYVINDKLTIGGYAGFTKCHIDEQTDNPELDGAKAWELSADAAYKITENLVYDCGAGVAQLKWGNNDPDPDKAYRVFHRLTVNF